MLKTEVSGLHFGTNLAAKLASAPGPSWASPGLQEPSREAPKKLPEPPGVGKKTHCYLPGAPEKLLSEKSPSQEVPGTSRYQVPCTVRFLIHGCRAATTPPPKGCTTMY